MRSSSSSEIDSGALARTLATLPGCGPEAWPRLLHRGAHSDVYLVEAERGPLVARLLSSPDSGPATSEQARRLARTLELLEPSDRAPRLVALVPQPPGLPAPLLVETFLPGRQLDYARDLAAVARCLADTHALGAPLGHGLPEQADPAAAILPAARAQVAPYLAWRRARPDVVVALRAAFAAVEREAPSHAGLFTRADLALVHDDVTARHVVIDADGLARLIGWDHACVAPVAQDLAGALAPTTTLWHDTSGAWLTPAQERAFLDIYLAARVELERARCLTQLAWLKRLVALRAVARCAGLLVAADEQPETDATLASATLAACAFYLEPDFLAGLFGL